MPESVRCGVDSRLSSCQSPWYAADLQMQHPLNGAPADVNDHCIATD